MTNQNHIEDRIIDYVYGELDANNTRELERHVAGCAHCADEVAKLQGVRRAAMALPQLAPRAHVTAAILHRGRELAPVAVRKPSLLSWFLRPAFAGAFLFVATLGVGLYVTRSGSHDGSREERPGVERFVQPEVQPDVRPEAASAPMAAAAPTTPAPAAGIGLFRPLPGPKPAGEADWHTAAGQTGQSAPQGGPPTFALNTARSKTAPVDALHEGSLLKGGLRKGATTPDALRRDPSPPAVASPFVPRDEESPRIVAQVARPAKEALFPSKDVPTVPPAPAAAAEPVVIAEGPKLEEGRRDRNLTDDTKATKKSTNSPGESELAAGFARGELAPGGARKDQLQTRGGAPKPVQEQRVARLAEPFGGSVGGYGQGSGSADGRLKQQQEGAIAQAQAPARTAYRMPASAPAPTSAQDKGVAQAAEPAAASREQTDADAATYGRAATEALLARAEVEHARGDYAAVVKTLEQLFRSNPGYAAPRAFELLASAHERRGDTAKAAVVRKQAAERTGR